MRYSFIQDVKLRFEHLPLEFHILSMLHLGAATPSDVYQLDEHRFLTEARGKAFFLELGWFARRDQEWEAFSGKTARIGDYQVRIEEVDTLPGESKPGPVRYLYAFEEPLRNPRNLFFQVLPVGGVKRIEFQ